MTRRLLLLTALFSAACGGVEEKSSDQPNPPPPAPAAAVVELGFGVTSFTPAKDGDRVDLVFAPQTSGGFGLGQHVDVALRAKNVVNQKLRATVTIRDDATTHAELTQELNFVEDGEWFVYAGLRAVITTGCEQILDASLTLEVDLVDANGKTANASVGVLGPSLCPNAPG